MIDLVLTEYINKIDYQTVSFSRAFIGSRNYKSSH